MRDYLVEYRHARDGWKDRLTIRAESIEDARVLAKYRVEVATDREFTVVSVSSEGVNP